MEGQVLNISPVIVWVVALSQLLNFALAVYGLLTSGARSNAEKLRAHADRLDDHGVRIGAIEQFHRTQPTTKDFHDLELVMEQLNGKLATMSAVISGNMLIMERMENIVSRHENYLLEGKVR
jgi:hypothetical protein